jgi:hypothetical protein
MMKVLRVTSPPASFANWYCPTYAHRKAQAASLANSNSKSSEFEHFWDSHTGWRLA